MNLLHAVKRMLGTEDTVEQLIEFLYPDTLLKTKEKVLSTTIKLQTNIPVTGLVKYIDFMPTKVPGYSDQIAVRGDWDGAGEGRVYLNVALEGEFKKAGLIGERSANGNYPLLVKAPRIKLVKTEEGNQKRTAVSVLSSEGSAPQPASQSSGQVPVDAKYAKTSWDQLILTMQNCVEAAEAIIGESTCDFGPIASTLFIERCKRNLLVALPPAEGSYQPQSQSELPF
jgi:hypothetical protein